MRGLITALLAGAAAVCLGFVLAAEAPPLRKGYQQLRSQARIAMGLEKDWVRIPGAERAASLAPRPCPSPDKALVILAGGQSNAANVVPTLHDGGDDVSVWFDGKCYPAADPLLGATGNEGSIWSMLGDEVAKQTGRPVVLIVAAVGGTQFRDWNDARSGYYAALSQRLETAAQAGFRPGVIVWHQGETDAKVEQDMAALRRELMVLSDRLLKDAPTAPLYLFQATRCSGRYRSAGVREVIAVFKSVATANPRIVLGMKTDVLAQEYRWDQCHFNARGRKAIVETALPQIVTLLQSAT